MQTIQLQGYTHTLCVPLSVFLHGPPTAPPETGERPFLFSGRWRAKQDIEDFDKCISERNKQMKKQLAMVLGVSAIASFAQSSQPCQENVNLLARLCSLSDECAVRKNVIKVIPTARDGGATWKYKEGSSAIANWADLSFDDKDWKEGVSGFGDSFGLRRTPWDRGEKDFCLRKAFSIGYTTEQIKGASLIFAGDDIVNVFLNGSELCPKKSGQWAKLFTVDITEAFKRLLRDSGQKNILAVKTHNNGGPCYIDVGLEIVLSEAVQVPESASANPKEAQSAAGVADVTLIPFGGTDWKYKMQGEVEENWESPDFNDAEWKNGESPFGNGNDDATSWTSPYICLRKSFDCPYDEADIKYLQIREGVDDILDVWLNGSHIFNRKRHKDNDLTTIVPRRLWEGLLRRNGNVLTVLARNWVGPQFVNVGLSAIVRQSAGKEMICPMEYVPAEMKKLFPATKLADIRCCSGVLTGDGYNWGRPTALLASNVKCIGDVRKTMQFQVLENDCAKCVCLELEQKGRDVWGRVLYCRNAEHCDSACIGVDFDALLCQTRRIVDDDSEISSLPSPGYALREFTVYFGSDANAPAEHR